MLKKRGPNEAPCGAPDDIKHGEKNVHNMRMKEHLDNK